MAQSTFQGPVKSLSGFVSAGQNTVTNVTASTSLTVAAHAGKLITVNGAAITLTLPLINATASSAATGPGADPQSLNNQGAVFTFFVQTAAAANLVFGSLVLNIDASAAGITFFPNGTSNYIITLNGSTKGGLVGSYITAQIVNANTWLIQGELNGSGALVTPFSG